MIRLQDIADMAGVSRTGDFGERGSESSDYRCHDAKT